jgi:hypothetical protein
MAEIVPGLAEFIAGAGNFVTDPAPALQAMLTASRAPPAQCHDIACQAAEAWQLGQPYRAAIARVAEAADRSGLANAYHNPGHTRDVVIAWIYLAALHDHLAASGAASYRLSNEHRAAGIIAALGHDLLHDANSEPRISPAGHAVPFRLETIAAAHTADLLAACGLQEATGRIVGAAIIATDPVWGYAALARAARGEAPGGHSALAALTDRGCWLVAAILRDADLMTSAGLTAAEHDRQAALLTHEKGEPAGTAAASERFFRDTVGDGFSSPAGALFTHRLQALRAANAARLRSGAAMTLAEAAHHIAGT